MLNDQTDNEVNKTETDTLPVKALYNENQILLHDLFENIELSSVVEVWDINFINASKHHFILVLSGGVHFCTCMLISTLEVVC